MRFNTQYDVEALQYLLDTIHLLITPLFLKWMLWLLYPTLLIYKINNGWLFMLFFVFCVLFTRSAKLGGLVGSYILAVTVMMFYFSPIAGHFIDVVLRIPPRFGSTVQDIKSSAEALQHIPKSLHTKIFGAMLVGVWAGGTIGLGIGMLGRRLFGKNPRVKP
jgi:hypothetical protein